MGHLFPDETEYRFKKLETMLLEDHKVRSVLDEDVLFYRGVDEVAHKRFAVFG
jgi:hypothetical protein